MLMATVKYIFITGGVTSSLGKGIIAASLGKLLEYYMGKNTPVRQEHIVSNLRAEGESVSHIHLRHICPFARNLGDLLKGFDKILVPEMNNGQLVTILRSEFLVPAEGLNKVTGQPFKIAEIEEAIRARLEN